mmetsp:Transcript_4531/g.6442  ORF Transcript_4531/g.6442 Transcript_4531/m.6442 type:complete len:289 (-) Transcript_4531:355-1221(-)
MSLIHVRPSIVLFGDSITQLGFGSSEDSGKNGSPFPCSGWASLLAAEYSRRADVLNRGFRGYNTEMALSILPSIFAPGGGPQDGRTLFVTVFFGANDALKKGQAEDGYVNTISDRRHVPVDQFGENIRKIVTLIRESFVKRGTESSSGGEAKAPPIILITPPPIHRKKFEEYCMESLGELRSLRTNDAAREHGGKVKEVAREMGCPVVDTFELLRGNGEEKDFEDYLVDGLHLTEKGNAIVFEGLMSVIKNELPELAPAKGDVGMQFEQPTWKDFYNSSSRCRKRDET